MTLPLNQGQEDAAEGFFQFLLSPEREFGITGPGGVGKTHLMGHMIDQIMPRYLDTCKLMGIRPEYDSVVMCATTNKAAEVLGQNTKRPTSTIHSFLGLKVKDDYTSGRSFLSKSNNWTVHERKVVFIDEGSMIDSPLDNYVQEGTHGCKLVYVGDHCQLKPVMETQGSPIYRRSYPTFELTEPMRTTIPALHAINNQLRETVETGEFKPIQLVPGVIDLLDKQQMPVMLAQYFAEQTQEARILAYTNKKVMLFNEFIREVRQLPSHYTGGEYLVNNTAIQLPGRMLSVEAEVTIENQGATYDMPLGPNLSLVLRPTQIRTAIGDVIKDVPVPEDRQHFLDVKKWFAQQRDWTTYYALHNKIPDLRQRDAATIHKAQGSSYDTVFIDLGDISTCHQPDQVARMLYVAFSRARSRVFLFGDLASKYGGLKA